MHTDSQHFSRTPHSYIGSERPKPTRKEVVQRVRRFGQTKLRNTDLCYLDTTITGSFRENFTSRPSTIAQDSTASLSPYPLSPSPLLHHLVLSNLALECAWIYSRHRLPLRRSQAHSSSLPLLTQPSLRHSRLETSCALWPSSHLCCSVLGARYYTTLGSCTMLSVWTSSLDQIRSLLCRTGCLWTKIGKSVVELDGNKRHGRRHSRGNALKSSYEGALTC